jgi:hypothetical protein
MNASLKIFLIAVALIILGGAGYMIWGRGLAPESGMPGVSTITSPFLGDAITPQSSGADPSNPSQAVSPQVSARPATKDDLIGMWNAVERGIDDQIMFLVSSAGKNVYSSSSDGEDSFVGCSWSYDGKDLMIDCSHEGITYTFNQVSISGDLLTIKSKDGLDGVYQRQE